MDLVSHVMVGEVFDQLSGLRRIGQRLLIVVAAFAPDIPVWFIYVLLGRANHREYWYPEPADWVGVRAAHPVWSSFWEIPHSFLFVLCVVLPIVVWSRWPRIVVASYSSHILLDIPTHTGEWAVKPLYPFSWTVNGFTDVWAWPVRSLIVNWVMIGAILAILRLWRKYSVAP